MYFAGMMVKFKGCADFAIIIFRKIGRAKYWHNRNKFEQNALS